METTNCPHTKLTTRYSWLFCDDCNTHIAIAAECCRSCDGTGTKQRMTSIYNQNAGKTYRCGKCKGTGITRPVPCESCDNPSVMSPSMVMGVDGIWRGKRDGYLRPMCQSCYDQEAGK